jgi:nucleotide-binding universal stress UspA family protein
MKTVLIAIDYNPCAVKVAEKGFLLANSIGAEVIFLHVISDLSVYSRIGLITISGFFANHMNTNTKLVGSPLNIKKLAYDFLDKIKFHLGNNEIRNIIKENDSVTSILETANEFDADIIIMGSYQDWSADSISQQVLLRTSVPLLIIPVMKRCK